MKSLVQDNVKLDYESALGDDFLLMDEWAYINLTPEEMLVYKNDEFTDQKKALFDRWATEQQITSLKIYIDGVLQD